MSATYPHLTILYPYGSTPGKSSKMSAQATPAPPAVALEFSVPTTWAALPVEEEPVAAERLQKGTTSAVQLSSSIFKGIARRTLGIALLLITVFLWTASNFLASVSVEQLDDKYCIETNPITLYRLFSRMTPSPNLTLLHISTHRFSRCSSRLY